MSILANMALAAMAAVLGWTVTRCLFVNDRFARTNVRGVLVPTGAGVVAAAASLLVGAGDLSATRSPVMVAVAGFALLGFLDDLWGTHEFKGFRGHLRALRSGRVTTGLVKLVGGGIVALLVVRAACPGSIGGTVIGAAVVALGANTANLFDRAPGRMTKVAGLACLVLVAATASAERASLLGTVSMMGAVLGLAWFELREELMLGDAGANPLGAALGLGVVLTTTVPTQVLVLAVLTALNVAGERISFSSVIEQRVVLRWFDQLGRRRA